MKINEMFKKFLGLKRLVTLLVTFLCFLTICPINIIAEDEHETIRVGFFHMDGYHMIDEDGNKSGYGYDFLRLMARYLDVEYDYVGYELGWKDMQRMLLEGEIDVLTSARKTPEREEIFDYSKPIGTNECMITVRSDNTKVIGQKYNTYDGLRVGLLKGNSRNNDFEKLADEKGFSYIPVYYEVFKDMEEGLQDGEVDALVSSSMRTTNNERIIEKFEPQDFYAIVKKGNTELLDKINYAIDQINNAEGDWQRELFNRYYASYDIKVLNFTPSEEELINSYKKPLKVLCDPTRRPYSYVEDGEMKGILPDFFKNVADYIGLPYEFVICKDRNEYIWYQSHTESIDIAIDARVSDTTIEKNHYGASAPYITMGVASIMRKDNKGDIKTIATVKQGSASNEIEKEYAPNAEKIYFDTRQEAMKAVRDGKADITFAYYYMAQEFVNNDASGSLIYNYINDDSFKYRMLVSDENNFALAGILTKGIYAQGEDAIDNIASNYTSYKASDMTLLMLIQMHPVAVMTIGMIMLALFGIVCSLSFKNRKNNIQLEDNLTKIKRDKYILDKLSADYNAVYYIELNKGTFEKLKIVKDTYADIVFKEKSFNNFDECADYYANCYLDEKNRREFLDWVSCAHLKEELNKRDKINFYYESIPNNLGQKYFAIQATKVYEDENVFYILLGFRFVDDILVKEKAIQEQLEDALDKTKKQNEIISAIAKTFNAIYRVDIINDVIEEIASDDISRHLKKDVASASEQFNFVCDNLVASEYRELVRPFMDISTLEERLKDEEFVTTEYKMNDGNWHRMRFVAKRKDANGRLTHVLCLIRIISDTKRTEENLYFEAEQAKKEVDMKTQFLKTMSHDIRTPLNGLIGMIKMADQYSDDVVMRSKLRNKAQQSLEYLVSLVNDILDMNKLQSGDLKDQQLTFDFINFLKELNHIYYDKAAEKGIKYDIDWENVKFEHSTLIGNPVYLGRALSNIASNAVKFSPSGSTITVWGNEEIIDDKHSLYTLYCKDEGEGMTDEFIKHAFDMFSQQNQTSRTKYEGSGLGLAMSKKLIERMGGSIKLESKKGVGTTAIIKVPFELGDTDTIGSIDYENVPTKGVHALLVDDNELNIEIAKFFLEDNGMEVTCAYDGKEAVDIFKKSKEGYFGVIYMDILMPNMNGLDATREIRALDRKDAKKVPIIAVSANTFSDDVFESRKAGMNKHLGKPLDEEKMIKAYKQCAVLSEEPIKLNGDL